MSVWSNKIVRRRLDWYYEVLRDQKPAKFLICKSIASDLDFQNSNLQDLWKEHSKLAKMFQLKFLQIQKKHFSEVPEAIENNFLDLKTEIAKRMLDSCNLCEWNCHINRNEGKIGVCRLDKTTRVSSWFRHFGEEAPLVNLGGSGTIFFTGCIFKCVFCQNWEISQYPEAGGIVDAKRLASIMKDLKHQGACNINFVGGEPTPNIHTIIDGMRFFDENIPMLWNSDMYATVEAMNLLLDVIDIWLPDFKYGNNDCARRLSNIPRYFEAVSRNHKIAYDNSSNMIIRHLVLPNHFDCCTKPVLKWISENCKNTLVNIMGQYRPDYKVVTHPKNYPEISRRLETQELQKAYEYAKSLGLEYESVS